MVELSGKPISLAVIRSLVDACGQFDLFSNKAFNKIARVLRDDIRGSCHYCFCDGKTRKSTGTVCSQLTAQLYFVLCLDIGLFNVCSLRIHFCLLHCSVRVRLHFLDIFKACVHTHALQLKNRNTEVVLNYSTVYRAVVVCVVIHMQ